MWIEIDLKGASLPIKKFVNFDKVVSVDYCNDVLNINFSVDDYERLYFPNADLSHAAYLAIKQALHGQTTTFEGLGHIKPFLKEQQKALYNYMLLKDLENDMSGGD